MGTNDKANRAKHETITVTTVVKERSGSLRGLAGKSNSGAISKKTGEGKAGAQVTGEEGVAEEEREDGWNLGTERQTFVFSKICSSLTVGWRMW